MGTRRVGVQSVTCKALVLVRRPGEERELWLRRGKDCRRVALCGGGSTGLGEAGRSRGKRLVV